MRCARLGEVRGIIGPITCGRGLDGEGLARSHVESIVRQESGNICFKF